MTETLRAIDALLARRPTTTSLAEEEEEEEEGAESVDGTLSQLLRAEEAVAAAVAEVEAEAVQPVASAHSVDGGFTRTEAPNTAPNTAPSTAPSSGEAACAPNTAPSTAPSSGEAACARLLGELGELQSPALGELQSPALGELQSPALGELQSPALELQSPALELVEVATRGSPGEGSRAQYGASAMRSAVMSAVEEDELVYQGGGASQGSQGGGASQGYQGGGASQGSQGSRERGVARFGIGLSVEGAVEGAEDEAIGERAGALGGEDGEGAAGPSLADSYADETLDDEAHEWRETLELLIPALPRLPPEQVSLVNRLIKTPIKTESRQSPDQDSLSRLSLVNRLIKTPSRD